MKRKIDLSLVIAGYNEGPTLPQSLEKIKRVLDGTKYSWEMICIDDTSKDDTPKHFKNFAKRKSNVSVFVHQKNVGRGGTVVEGIQLAKGTVVGFIDVDLEVSPIYISEFVEAILDGKDVAIAHRIYKENLNSILRWISSKGYVTLARMVLGINYKDTEAGYKFFNRQKILKVLKKIKSKGWFFDTEIIVRSQLARLKIVEIPVLFLRRDDKKSTVRLIPDSINHIKGLITLRKSIASKK